jgi:eukaryotic-like serine/threonine-protein kinase
VIRFPPLRRPPASGTLVVSGMGDHQPGSDVTLPQRPGAVARPPAVDDLPPGTLLDRYVVLGRLGAGGMGVVYAAHDPELDRKIAVKLLGERTRPGSRDRLQREAQAMARLSHPAVVPVFDVGTHGDQLFVAMELVDGQTLTAHLRERRPGWRAALALYLQAGRGLAAAHEAGIVHRDFKPDNVLVGRDGRARVTDFGLARFAASDEVDEPVPAVISPALPMLTRSGAILGTPAYMAPEQHLGRAADERADQFSFCVALYDALYGRRPFKSEDDEGMPSVIVLAGEVTGGRVRPPPRRNPVPGWLGRIVLRGLALDPADRWPSMAALLDAIDAGGRRRRRLLVGAAVLVGAGAIAAGFVATRPDPPAAAEGAEPCPIPEQQMAGVWDPATARKVGDAFAASKAPLAGRVWPGVERAMNDRRERWLSTHVDACEAASVTRAQSTVMLDLRMACLQRRRSEMTELVGVLATADATVVEHALDAVEGLPAIELCNDLHQLMGKAPPPSDPAVAARVERIRRDEDRANALNITGRPAEARKIADAALVEARAIGYVPLLAEAEWWSGTMANDNDEPQTAVRLFMDSLHHATAVGDDQLAAEAADGAFFVNGYVLQRSAETEMLEGLVLALRERNHGNDRLEFAISTNLAFIRYTRARFAEARVESDRGLAAGMRLDGGLGYRASYALTVRANILSDTGDHEGALADYRRIDDIIRKRFGDEHPNRATVSYNVGLTQRHLGRYEESLQSLERARTVFERLGHGIEILRCLHNEARTRQDMGQLDAALAGYRAVLQAGEAAVGPDAAELAYPLTGIGAVLRRQGKLAAAEPPLRRALTMREKWFGSDNPYVAETLAEIGMLAFQRGRTAEARALLGRLAAVCDHMYCKDIDLAEVRAARAKLGTDAGAPAGSGGVGQRGGAKAVHDVAVP